LVKLIPECSKCGLSVTDSLEPEVEEHAHVKRDRYVNSVWICNDCIENGKEKKKLSGISIILIMISFLFGTNIMMIIIHTEIGMAFAASDFLIQKTSSFVDQNKIMHVYGEVKNISDKAMTNVIAKALFYDANGKLLNEFQRSSELRTINPGNISPFEILNINTKTVNSVKDFKLSAIGTPIEKSKPTALKIHSDNSRLDILGFYYINGRIVNGGPLTAADSSVIATLYDKDSKVIAIGRALAEPVNIIPNSHAAFGIVATEKLQTYKIKSYSLIADSDQYVSLPVFLSK
jgi:hypothetical protein